jgi:large subunit ribosomal protein L10
MATKKKKETVKSLSHLFTESQVLIFTDYRGLTVSDLTHLRRQLREKGVEYHITKNTLAELAAGRSSMDAMLPMLDGPTAIAFVKDDIPGAAKALQDFLRTNKVLQVRGGLMGNTAITADQVSDLTKILTRDQYLSQVLGAMRAPIQNVVNVLNAPLQNFVNVLNAYLDKRSQGDEASGEGAVVAEAAPTAEVTPVEATIAETAPEAEAAPEVEVAPEAEAAPETEVEAAPEAESAPEVEAASEAEAADEA